MFFDVFDVIEHLNQHIQTVIKASLGGCHCHTPYETCPNITSVRGYLANQVSKLYAEEFVGCPPTPERVKRVSGKLHDILEGLKNCGLIRWYDAMWNCPDVWTVKLTLSVQPTNDESFTDHHNYLRAGSNPYSEPDEGGTKQNIPIQEEEDDDEEDDGVIHSVRIRVDNALIKTKKAIKMYKQNKKSTSGLRMVQGLLEDIINEIEEIDTEELSSKIRDVKFEISKVETNVKKGNKTILADIIGELDDSLSFLK